MEESGFYVYTIHNLVNNKIYIGKTTNPKKRWNDHLNAAKNKNPRNTFYIHRAIIKYGRNSFIFSVVQKFDNEKDALKAEKYWISYFQSNNSKLGYNLTSGGEGASGRIVPQETRIKIGLSCLGRKHSDDTKKKIADGHRGDKNFLYGKTIPQETRNKFSIAKIGKYSRENNPRAKLNFIQVTEIRQLRQEGFSLKKLSIKFGISIANVSDIINNKIWKINE